MRIVGFLIIAIVALLSFAAGLAKVMQAPQEMAFLQGLGLSPALIVVFGLIQVTGGLLLVIRKTRKAGAILAATAFVVSAILIFIGDGTAFGLLSLLPVGLAGVIIHQSAKTQITSQ